MNQPDQNEKEIDMDGCLADRVAEKLIARLSDEKTVDAIVGKWSASIDKAIGRGVRRALGLLFLALCGIAVIKFNLLEKLIGVLAK